MLFLNTKGGEDEDEDKNIVNAKAPLHEVSTQVFKPGTLPIFNPHKNKKSQREPHPEKRLVQRLPDGNLFIFFTQQAKIKCKSQ